MHARGDAAAGRRARPYRNNVLQRERGGVRCVVAARSVRVHCGTRTKPRAYGDACAFELPCCYFFFCGLDAEPPPLLLPPLAGVLAAVAVGRGATTSELGSACGFSVCTCSGKGAQGTGCNAGPR